MKIDRDKLIELAAQAGFKIYQLPTSKEYEIHSIGKSFEIELSKFADLVSDHTISSMRCDS